MNPGATAERVLETLRQQIVERGFRPGDRLDPGIIASQMATSVTPVRDALNRLTGEGLVEARQGGGFQLPLIDELLLHDLYQWTEQVLLLAVSCWPRSPGPYPASLVRTADRTADRVMAPAERTAEIFALIAHRSTNSQHSAAIERLNARLHVVRQAEPVVIEPTDDDFAPWLAAIDTYDLRAMRDVIVRYHRRRHRSAAAILRAAYRGIL